MKGGVPAVRVEPFDKLGIIGGSKYSTCPPVTLLSGNVSQWRPPSRGELGSMPGTLAWSDSTVRIGVWALAGAAVVVLAMVGFRYWRASRLTPEDRERLRRAMVVARGKMGDALIVEFRDNLIFFTYSVRGVEYTASQDISALKSQVPQDLSSILPVAVKYLPQNPANSIVVAEEWSGLRTAKA